MEMKYYLVDILAKNFETIKDKFIGKTDKHKIDKNSETSEDIFQDKILDMLENYPDHYSNSESEELKFIQKLLKKNISSKNIQRKTVEYNDNYENLVIDDYTNDAEYNEKLELLLIQYRPIIK